MVDQTLALTQSQHQLQILAPQLRQSLELLQAPILEVRTLIQNELQNNITLEEIPPASTPVEVEPGGSEVDDAKELNFDKEVEILSRIDDEWYNYFMQQREYKPYDASIEKKRNFFLDSRVQEESLQEHLTQQLHISGLNEADSKIGELLIGNINDDGYLVQGIEELSVSVGQDPGHVMDVLGLIQDFDPIGVAARDLRECLLLQMERLGQGDSLAAAIVKEHLDAMGRKHFKEIASALKVSLAAIQQAAKLISTLEPRPGRAFSSESTTYILPEVVVRKLDKKYVVILNDDQIPHLRISKQYRQLLRDEHTTRDVVDYIKNKMKAGLFLIKSVVQRQQTLSKVATEIVRVQHDFFDHGIAHLKPLTMVEVAKKVGLHETTICRCIANKYMNTPYGVFEMKYFFTPGLKTEDGSIISNKTVKDMIASLVANENQSKPLSDHEMQEQLKVKGIIIARRTVAKYRIALKIPPSHLRKSP